MVACWFPHRGGHGDWTDLPFRSAMIGLEEGLVPHYRALVQAQEWPDGDALEEELRGFYVGLTRARERVFMSACLQRSRGEQAEPRQPSRWLQARPPDLLVAV
jgi:DNA helicase-2/ATP-dependent DNA helicase PcrA